MDVSSEMEPYLTPLTKSLFTFIHSQIVFKPDNQVALFLFGTDKTDNDLHEEVKKRQKKPQYQHVKLIRRLQAPDVSYLEAVEHIRAEKGPVDYIDALTVAIDCMKRKLATMTDPSKYTRRILFFSAFFAKVKATG